MEIETRKTVDMLTRDSVSILTQKFVTIDEQAQQVGEYHRKAYVNSAESRTDITENEPNDVVVAVMAMWGDTPTISETEPITE